MGVDAEMFVRVKGRKNWLRDEQELAASYELASTVGAEHFFVMFGDDGKLREDGHHALSIIRPIKDAQEAEYCGAEPEYIGKVIWTQDGPEIVAADDEQFVRVHLWSRYYGPDYARGNWPVIRLTIEWLQMRFPGAEVWYGGDSSGICAEHMTPERVKQFNDFFLESGRKTYQRAFTSLGIDGKPPTCPCCLIETNNCGGGQDAGYFYCDGCGQKFIKERRAGKVHLLGRHQEFFAAHANIREGKPAKAERKAA